MILFYIFLALIPFQFALNPLEGVDLANGRVLALLLIIVLLLKGLKNRSLVIPLSSLSLLLLFFLFWSGLSIFWSEDVTAGARKFLFFLNFFPLFWLLPGMVKRGTVFLESPFIYPALIASLAGITQFILQFIIGADGIFGAWENIAPFLYGKGFGEAIIAHPSWLVELGGQTVFRAIGFFPDPHIFGFYLAFVTPMAFSSRRKLFKWFGAIFVFAVLLTFSRGAYIGAIGALISYLVVISVKRKAQNEKQQLKTQNFTFFVFVFSFSLLIFSFLFTPFGSRFFSSFNLLEGSVAGRLEIWGETFSVIKEHPLLGVGLGGYAAYIEPGVDYRVPIYAHNLYLDIWSELGIIGLGAWLGIMLLAAINSLRSEQYPLFFTFVWFSLQSFFDTPIFSVHILPLLILFFSFINFGSPTSKIFPPQPLQ